MKNRIKSHLIAFIVTVVFAAVGFYITLPAISIHNPGLLFDIVFLCIVYNIAFLLSNKKGYKVDVIFENGRISKNVNLKETLLSVKATAIIAGIAIAVWAVGSLTGAVFFNAKKYQKLLEVQSGNFLEDVDSISYDQIPTLDKDSAIRLGDRKLGELSDMVSQFAVMDNYYSQINYKGTPVRVTPLMYVDVFKWISNVSDGIPGYIMINMVTQDVSLMRFSELGVNNMKYSTAEHFGRNLYRHLRFNYPTYIFEEPNFEINEEGIPYWVCARKNFNIGLYGGEDICGAVLVNAIDGSCTYYDIKDVPSWVDRVYNAELIIEQFDYHGTLQHGFWNSILSQKDCQETTAGYNYIAMNDDVYMYTGITSVASDQSNIGFILANQRTKETKFYEISGAEEYSAMSSAEGEVQNLRYVSTFPLLLNIGNEPTYFVALKDAAQLVKMYAMVNVAQYQIVATGQTLMECEENYIKLIKQSGLHKDDISLYESISGSIQDIRTAVINGNSYYFFKIEGYEPMYMISVAENKNIVSYNIGDTVTIEFIASEDAVITAKSINK